jgi:ATP-dependent Clp protease protease subunit
MLKRLEVDPRIKVKHDTLLDQPIIIRLKKFNEEGADKFTEELNKAQDTGQPIIPIVVDSYGGQVYTLLGMISEIQSCKIPIVTVCESKAMSCGAVLFTFGQQRFMAPHATLMIHEVSSMSFGKIEEIKSDAAETDRLNNYIFDLLDKNCGKHKNYFLDLIHKKSHADWYLDAKECKKHGLCHNIHLPSFNIKVSVNYEFK